MPGKNITLHDPWVRAQFLLLGIILAGAPLLPRIYLGPLDTLLGLADAFWLRSLGLVILTAGLILVLWAGASLGPNLTAAVEPVASGSLVSTGAYARIRHPIYAGMILFLAGYTLAWSNWRLALLVLWGTSAFFGAKAGAEERRLVERFPAYAQYRRRVPKLLPWGRPS